MRIIVAERAGFCFGVKRAAKMAFEAAERAEGEICSLGPIIHSPQLVARLEEEGVRVVKDVEQIDGGGVIIRSHGVTAGEMEAIRRRGLKVIDATCPFVKKAQDYAALLAADGYDIVVVGEAEHPEVQGIVSYARGGKGMLAVVADREQAEAMIPKKTARLGVVAQTTQEFENLRQIVDVCLERSRELRVYNTICDATTVRQEEAKAIARQVDLMLVIGGFNSANTNRLAQICQAIQPRTHHIEVADEIDPAWFAGIETVGITAGASTPKWIVDAVVERVSGLEK